MAEVGLIELLAFLAGIALILLILTVAIYVYFSLATMRIAKKIGTKHSWLAWIPIANFFLYSRMAGMHWWPVFLLAGMFIPNLEIPALIAFTVFLYIWFWRIFNRIGRPGWWILLSLIPIAGWLIFLILLGVAAWSDESKTPSAYTPPITRPVRTAPKSQARTSSSRLDRVKKLKGSLK